jgi:hypothetical protein
VKLGTGYGGNLHVPGDLLEKLREELTAETLRRREKA